MSTLRVEALEQPDGTAFVFNNKNLLINGGMNVWQRSTSVTGITTSAYRTADRWLTSFSSMGTWTQSRSTDVPSAQGFGYSLKMDCTTADASPAAGDYIIYNQRIEGQNLQHLLKGTSSAKAITLSFWIKSNKTGTYICELYDNDNNRSISKSYTIDSASTWEKKTITFEGDTTGTLDNDNAASLYAQWWFGAGSNYTSGTLQTSWGTLTTANRAVGQVNLADSTSNELYITGCQLEVGSTASGFEFEPYEAILRKCLRYFVQDVFAYAGTMGGGSANVPLSIIQFPVRMRQAPTITWISGGTVSDGQYDSTISSQNTTQNINPFSARVLFNRNTSGTPSVVGRGCDVRGVTMKYDAEL
tara:strand:+ start:535 stop:1611 length:1077 start_codon:yes stop_codon:yes gene_type:complete